MALAFCTSSVGGINKKKTLFPSFFNVNVVTENIVLPNLLP